MQNRCLRVELATAKAIEKALDFKRSETYRKPIAGMVAQTLHCKVAVGMETDLRIPHVDGLLVERSSHGE